MRALVVVFAICGCGPSLHALAEARHYREAVCAAHDGSSDDRDQVGAALDADAGVAVHVHAVSQHELARVVGDAAGPIWDRVRFARVEVQTNALPIDGFTVAADLDDGETKIATPVDWDALARVTGEPLPAKQRRTTYLTGGNVLRAIATIATGGLAPLGAIAVGHPFTFHQGVVDVDAPDDDYRRLAPRAHALFHAMATECAPSGPISRDAIGARCTWFFAMERETRGPAELRLTLRYRANRIRGDDLRPDETCTLERSTRISLGFAADLDATADRMFGAKMRELAEVRATR